jgi:hypothetical protein
MALANPSLSAVKYTQLFAAKSAGIPQRGVPVAIGRPTSIAVPLATSTPASSLFVSFPVPKDPFTSSMETASKADTLLISCGGWKTIDLLVPLENKCKVPVVSSTPHTLMNAVRLAGLNPRVEGYGSVLVKAKAAWAPVDRPESIRISARRWDRPGSRAAPATIPLPEPR